MRLINKDGTPLGESVAHSISDWLRKSVAGIVDADTVALMDRCAICMRGTWTSGHASRKCPLLASMNKMRAHKDLIPISIGVNHLVDSAKKKPLTLEALEKKHAQELRDMRSKVGMSLTFPRLNPSC